MAVVTTLSRTRTYPQGKQDVLKINNRMTFINPDNPSETSVNYTQIRNRKTHFDKSQNVERKGLMYQVLANNHSGTETVRKAPPKKVKRTDSYKLATRRKRSFDDLDNVVHDTINARNYLTRELDEVNSSQIRCNTMPSRIRSTEIGVKPEHKHTSVLKTQPETKTPERSSSQKSGTVPSSDSDEEKCEVQNEKKKKSIFKRIKERLVQTFRKSKVQETKQETNNAKGIFIDPNGSKHLIFNKESNTFEIPQYLERSDTAGKGMVIDIEVDNSDPLRTKIQSTEGTPRSGTVNTDGDHYHTIQSEPVDIPDTQHNSHGGSWENQDEHFSVNTDNISEIFGSLIDPSTPFLTLPNQPRADRSNLRLDGLQKYRPKSFERREVAGRLDTKGQEADCGRSPLIYDIPSSVGMDRPSYADSPVISGASFQDGDNYYMSRSEHVRRLYDYGRRFAAIGDRLVADREVEKVVITSKTEDQRLSSCEQQLIDELKKYTDTKNEEFLKNGRGNISTLPVIKNLVRAHDYARFKQIVMNELSNTIRWEQVAWFTYLIKTTMCVVGTGRDLGRILHQNATRYFNAHMRPWIESRPNGWDSIYEETDIDDSELD